MTKQEILMRVYRKLSQWAIEDADNEDISVEFYSTILRVRLDIVFMLK